MQFERLVLSIKHTIANFNDIQFWNKIIHKKLMWV